MENLSIGTFTANNPNNTARSSDCSGVVLAVRESANPSSSARFHVEQHIADLHLRCDTSSCILVSASKVK